jgi:putative hemolysin
MDELIIVAVCLFLNAIFAAYEMAFVSMPASELRALARKGNKNAQSVLGLRENPERTLSIIQIGITLVGAIAAAVGGLGASESLEPYFVSQFELSERAAEFLSIMLIVLPLTFLSVVIGELVPKSLALRNPRRIVLSGAQALIVVDRVLAPVISILENSTKLILRTLFKKQKKEENFVQSSVEIDTLSPVHQRFVLNMVNIETKQIKDILLPWDQVTKVNSSDSIDDVTSVVLSSGHTRLPVESDGYIQGVLHTKEFMTLRESGTFQWQSIVRPVLGVRVTDSALAVLRFMQERRSHLCVVFSLAGERTGIVTLEDIVEEVFGDIYDEDDDGRVRKIFAVRAKDKTIQ